MRSVNTRTFTFLGTPLVGTARGTARPFGKARACTSYGKTGQFHVLSLPVGCAPLIWHRPNVSWQPDGAITAGCAIGGSAPISPPITQCPESCGYCTYPCFSEKAKVLGDYHYDPDDPRGLVAAGRCLLLQRRGCDWPLYSRLQLALSATGATVAV